jgi:hypothetical protein
MHVILDPADDQRWAVKLLGHAAKISMEFRSFLDVPKEGPAFLGGEDRVQIDGG